MNHKNLIVQSKFALCSFSLHKAFAFLLTICVFPSLLSAQKIALLVPDKSAESQNVREKLEQNLAKNFRIVDDSVAEIVPLTSPDQNIFNLSTDEAQNFGKALGCNYFVLIKAATLRRATLSKPDFHIESYAVVYLVSTTTGRLIFWKLSSFKSQTSAESEKQLFDSLDNLAAEISGKINSAGETENDDNDSLKFAELPEENSSEAKNFRSPLPYRRLKPEYTATANLYNVTAIIDAAVELDENGNVRRVEIERWAGYGLDESVAATIRKMQWRAAEKDGKTLPVRVLLRYNFKKLEHDDE